MPRCGLRLVSDVRERATVGVEATRGRRLPDHRWRAAVHGLDDLVRIDALQIDRGHAEVAVTELALNDVERHVLAKQLRGLYAK